MSVPPLPRMNSLFWYRKMFYVPSVFVVYKWDENRNRKRKWKKYIVMIDNCDD